MKQFILAVDCLIKQLCEIMEQFNTKLFHEALYLNSGLPDQTAM